MVLFGYFYGLLLLGIVLKDGVSLLVDNVVLYGLLGFDVILLVKLGMNDYNFFVMIIFDDFIWYLVCLVFLYGWGLDGVDIIGIVGC